MTIDLSALDRPAAPYGKPLQLLLSEIDEDPNQPRKIFTPEAMAQMAESIRRRGVRSPVSVRPHPSEPGRYMLNHGARRLRGSFVAGKETIPAIIDETHTDYDQVIENLQRDDLKPLELANFIRSKLKGGDKKAYIARQLGIDASSVTQHLALIDPPACLEAVYTSGRCQSPKTLYDLRTLYESHPDAVIRWCTTSTEITRRTVARLGETLKVAPINMAMSSDHEDNGNKLLPPETLSPDEAGRLAVALSQNLIPSVALEAVPVAAPKVWIDVEGRRAQLVLNQRPVQPDHVFVRFEGSSKDESVRAGGCRLVQLTFA